MVSRKVAKNVRYLLEAVPRTKADYNLLIAFYWMLFDEIEKVEDVPRATPAETIMRARRKIISKEDDLVEQEKRESSDSD